jgi:endonuclease/exonuclease/phosphatase (EEP) superfamily protein YafD
VDAAPAGRSGRRWRILLIASAAPFLGILAAAFAAWWWPGELCSHWTLHGAFALLPAAIVWRRHHLLGPLAMAAIAFGALPWFVAAWEERAPALRPEQRRLRVLQANVLYENPHRVASLPMLAEGRFDLLSLIEVNPEDRAALAADPRWPHQAWHLPPRRRPGDLISGVALLSAHPLAWWTLHEVDTEGIIEAEVILDGARLRVLVGHPKSPMTPKRLGARQRQLARIADLAAAAPGPVIAMGDFNCSVGSPAWRGFRAASGLRRAAQPSPATWPSFAGPLGIGIDHVLVAGGAALGEVEAPRIPGSDHRALVGTVGLPTGDAAQGTLGR